jgi:hypothetical protein
VRHRPDTYSPSRGYGVHRGSGRATTTIFSFATQGAWLLPTETLCSFQAAILQTPSDPFGGWGDGENRCASSGCLTLWFAANEQIAYAKVLSFTSFPILLHPLNHSNDALPSPYQVTLVGICLPSLLARQLSVRIQLVDSPVILTDWLRKTDLFAIATSRRLYARAGRIVGSRRPGIGFPAPALRAQLSNALRDNPSHNRVTG